MNGFCRTNNNKFDIINLINRTDIKFIMCAPDKYRIHIHVRSAVFVHVRNF